MRLLVIKTSSLGDVVHMLPALTDARRHLPGLQADWVVEEGFAAIPALHGAVRRVIPVAIRRWRRQLGQRRTWQEMAAFRRALRADSYDLVLDSQGLLKSALLAAQAHGPKAGFDAASAREALAARFYGRRFRVPWDVHAIRRNRLLTALALGYPEDDPDAIRYGLASADTATGREVLCLHGTARPEKELPEARWVAVARELSAAGLIPVLPAGNAGELARARRIAAAVPEAQVLAAMALAEVVAVLARARAVIGVDTGLMHLAAALRKPGVGLYVATDPARYGARAEPDAPAMVNLSGAAALDVNAVIATLFQALAPG